MSASRPTHSCSQDTGDSLGPAILEETHIVSDFFVHYFKRHSSVARESLELDILICSKRGKNSSPCTCLVSEPKLTMGGGLGSYAEYARPTRVQLWYRVIGKLDKSLDSF